MLFFPDFVTHSHHGCFFVCVYQQDGEAIVRMTEFWEKQHGDFVFLLWFVYEYVFDFCMIFFIFIIINFYLCVFYVSGVA